MKVSIQYNDIKREYEGTACVFGSCDEEKTEGAILGDSQECLISLLWLNRHFLKECTLYDKITFMKIMMEIMEETEEKAC